MLRSGLKGFAERPLRGAAKSACAARGKARRREAMLFDHDRTLLETTRRRRPGRLGV